MSTRVVHCKKHDYDVYIGRGRCPKTNQPGKLGNPFRIGEHGTREQVVERYRAWLWTEIQAGRITLKSLAELRGKTLACWCAPHACHGDVLAAAADWAYAELHALTTA